MGLSGADQEYARLQRSAGRNGGDGALLGQLAASALPSAPAVPHYRGIAVSSDTAVVTIDAAADGAYNRAYNRGVGDLPAADWPVDYGRGVELQQGGGSNQQTPQVGASRPCRIMMDKDRVAIYGNFIAGHTLMIYVDGAPLSLAGYTIAATKAQLITIVFNSGDKPRLVEVFTDGNLFTLYTVKPGKLWKPEPYGDLNVMVQGDSYAAGVAQPNVGAGTGIIPNALGAYQTIAPLLGVGDVLADAIGGTGYVQGGLNSYVNRFKTNVLPFNPDVLIVHGGGANDFFNGVSDAAVLEAATNHFKQLRGGLPNAKLVFVEGFAPPTFNPAAINPRYIQLRKNLQSVLRDVGVYYIDVATTDPWINGAGYVTNPNADTENSSIYVGSDGTHLTIKGNEYVKQRLASRIRRIIRDNGSLLNQLI